ncbi:MAG: hypothetical protein LQ349_007885 [Xanthoria aureola]|nr:MAG: hypothetical protein LQ349_007885 [Xanthoria aureola]
MKIPRSFAALGIILTRCVLAVTVAEVRGNRYLSPFSSKSFTNLTGVVTFIGFYTSLRSLEPDDDESTGESIGILGYDFGLDYAVGDIVTLDGSVWDDRPWNVFLPTISIVSPHNVRLVSRGNPVRPVILGRATSGIIGNKDLRPPTEQYNKLDQGNVFGVPNSVASVSRFNLHLEPGKYGMDFFQSLCAELVTIRNPTALGRRAKDGALHSGPHLWVYGNWPVTGNNSRGGLTVTDGDANPETLILFEPVDGTQNPNTTRLGDSLTDITGVIEYISLFGLYYIRPSTAPKVKSSRSPSLPPPSAIRSDGRCSALSVAEYNLEDWAPNNSRIPIFVDHIATYLGNPSIIFLQGIQDSSGPTDDGTIDASLTLSQLTQALEEQTGIPYNFVDINPLDNNDGVERGHNIRNAYIFNPSKVRLHHPNPGNSSVITSILPGPSLRFNPGRVDAPPVFEYCRKPLVAHWEMVDDEGATFFTVNVQLKHKAALSTLQTDPRPPGNPWINDRIAQANVTGSFIAHILAQDKNAAIIAAGDFAEYAFVEPLKQFVQITGLRSMDVLSGIPEVERYTSTSGSFAYGSQDQLTHMFVSPSIARYVGREDFEHVHVNTWAAAEDAAGVYDPSLARLNVCKH